MRGKQEQPSAHLSPLEKYKELNTRQVATYVGVTGPQTVWAYVKEGRLPKHRDLKPHHPIWRLGELLDHTHSLMQDFDDAPRGYVGKKALQTQKKTNIKNSGLAETIRERLFGK